MQSRSLSGILVIDKPEGLTSTKALEKVKKILRVKKAGHGGTLDPIATGVLPVFLGKATKVAQIFLEGDKVYEGEMELGITTTTYDITGEVLEKKEVPRDLSLEKLQELADSFKGEQKQTPPPFSAAKFRGRPLYKYARDGLFIPKEPKPIKIYDFSIKEFESNKVKFYLHCSKGTYVRSIVHGFGQKLGCGAVLTKLRRLKKSIFSIDQAITIETLKELVEKNEVEKVIIPIEDALSFLPKVIVSEEFSKRIMEGRQMHTSSFLSFIKFQKLTITPSEKWIRIINTKGKLVAIIENPLLNPSSPYIKYFRVFKNQ